MTYDIIIVGAGIAGLTAAIYAKRAGKSVLILESHSYGGQIVTTPKIENYPATLGISGFDFANKIYEQAMTFGAEIKYEKVINIVNSKLKKVTTEQNTYQGKTVILATGSKNRLLGLPNEQNFIGKGVSYCASCDGAFYRNQTVAVVGGGNTALQDTLDLADLAQKVYLIHRHALPTGEAVLLERIKQKKNVVIVPHAQITALCGEQKLSAIQVEQKQTTKQIVVDGLFVAIGRVPENINFASVVQLDQYGYIVAGEDCVTSTPGIFAAGDCRTKDIRQLVTAAGDGAVAANHAVQYLNAQ